MKTTVDELFIVSDCHIGRLCPFQKEDLKTIKKHSKILDKTFDGMSFPHGFYKITITKSFFGIFTKVSWERLKMEV